MLLWIASLAAGFADNWFALRGMRGAVMHHRRLARLGTAARNAPGRMAGTRGIAGMAGTMALALLFGVAPAKFFDVPFELHHVTFAAGSFAAAAGSLGWQVLARRNSGLPRPAC